MPFRLAFKFSSSNELALSLARNVVYRAKGIIVLNKPFGVSFGLSDGGEQQNLIDVCLQTALPELKRELGAETLIRSIAPERSVSGVAVFCEDKSMHKKLHLCVQSMRMQRIPFETYDAVVVGCPAIKNGDCNAAVSLLKRKGSRSKTIICERTSNNSVRRGDAKRVTFSHQTTAIGVANTSRIEVAVTTNRWFSVRAFLASRLLCPVLGDEIFGSRVKHILGKSVLVDVNSSVVDLPQKISPELQKALGIVGRKDIQIPLHLHLGSLRFKNLLGKGEDLVVQAEPPSHFLNTCSLLELNRDLSSADVVCN